MLLELGWLFFFFLREFTYANKYTWSYFKGYVILLLLLFLISLSIAGYYGVFPIHNLFPRVNVVLSRTSERLQLIWSHFFLFATKNWDEGHFFLFGGDVVLLYPKVLFFWFKGEIGLHFSFNYLISWLKKPRPWFLEHVFSRCISYLKVFPPPFVLKFVFPDYCSISHNYSCGVTLLLLLVCLQGHTLHSQDTNWMIWIITWNTRSRNKPYKQEKLLQLWNG